MSKKIKIKRIKPEIKYCGSLICQNHGESLVKGFIKWDVKARTGEFKQIINDYGYYTLDIDEGKLPIVEDIPPKARLRLRLTNTDNAELKVLLANIRKTYGIQDITLNHVDSLSKQKLWNRDGSLDVGDVSDPDYQNKLIIDYINRNFNVTPKLMETIIDINTSLNRELPPTEVVRNSFWKLKKFKFSNMFSYGEDNVVDFEKLNGIVGLFAPNATGKSSLLDALSFCLFDTSSRAFKAIKIMNNKKNSFECELSLDINDVEYGIRRTAVRQKKGTVTVKVDFWYIDESDEVVSLNGDQRRTTNMNIRKVIGTYEDFILTSMSLQNNFTVFIDKTQTERKELLAQFMGIGIFDKLYTLAHDNISDVTSVLKTFKQRDYAQELTSVEDTKKEYQSQHISSEALKTRKEAELDVLEADIRDLHTQLKSIDSSIINIDALNAEKSNIEQNIIDTDVELKKLLTAIEKQQTVLTKLGGVIQELEDSKIDSKFDELIMYESDRALTQNEIDKLKIEIRHKLDKLEKLENLEYDPDCDYCMNNPFTIDAIETKKELEVDKVRARAYIEKIDIIDAVIKGLGDVRENKERYDRFNVKQLEGNNILQSMNSEKVLIISRLQAVRNNLETVIEKIHQHSLKEHDILINERLVARISDKQSVVDKYKLELAEIYTNLQHVHGEIERAKTLEEQLMKDIDKIHKLETENEAYGYYLDAVKRDGISYELIEQSLPTIETAINDVLAQIVDFSIVMNMDGKNINTFIAYDDSNWWPLELSSGMERFISSLAIRVGLINVCNLPRNNSLFLDEGFSNLDADHMNSLNLAFQFLKMQFPFVLVISHVESMKDIVDTYLEINKNEDDNYSSVNFE